MTKPLPTKPSFCIITPTAYLEDYAIQSKTHLVLAHLVDTNEQYAKFYKERSDAGEFIICDNGAFELGESYAPHKLVELGHKCGADAIVLPDYPGQPTIKTIQAAIDLLPTIKGEGFKAFYAPQSGIGDLEGWIYGYQWGVDHPDIDIVGMSILAIPNAIPRVPKSYARVLMTEILHNRNIFGVDKYHHYLGLNAAPNVELPSLILSKSLDSCDSSNPVWFGINGIQYNTTFSDFAGVQKKYIRHVDFDEPFTSKTFIEDVIQTNVNITLDLFKHPKDYL